MRHTPSHRACLLMTLTSTLTLALATSFVAHARRLPGPGGKVTVALPQELVGPTSEAHLYAPLVEPTLGDDAATSLARPPIPGFPEWKSSVLRAVRLEDNGAVWRFTADQSAQIVGDSVARCFSKRTEGSWPAAVLQARGVNVDVSVAGPDVRVKFSEPVGPMLELLAGCPLRTSSGAHTGGYTAGTAGILVWRSGGYGPPPLLGFVEVTSAPAGTVVGAPSPLTPLMVTPPTPFAGAFTGAGAGGAAGAAGTTSRADIVAFGAESPGSATLLAPFPDVLVLLQSPGAKKKDPLGLFDSAVGTLGFRQRLRADLLAAAYAQGRGGVADGLLPPGIAPARPLPQPQGPERLAPLALVQLPANAPRLAVRRSEGDQLIDGVVERLAVLLRNRGYLVDFVRQSASSSSSSAAADSPDARASEGVEVLRWRPPTSDPALALLSLAGARPTLAEDEAARRALRDPRLLSSVEEERVAAAVALERAWLDAGLAVPLLTADRWFSADPDLRGVRIREDGVPLLHDATFGGLR